MSPNVRIVLIDTTHPGNIGAVARAMKNMGVHELVLVRPQVFPSVEAMARASAAGDILERARVVETLDEALKDCALVVGTTARSRMHHCTVLDVREAAQKILTDAQVAPVAIVFGSERAGLTNEEILRCNALIRIPTNPEYESLNLSMAVQIVCYELFLAGGAGVVKPPRETPLANADQMHHLYAHLEQILEAVGFVDRTPHGASLMGRFKRLFNRAELDQNEANILRGLFTAIQGKRRPAGQRQETGIYLDHAATTPVDARVVTAMSGFLDSSGDFGNPSAVDHPFGHMAREAVEKARAQVAALIGARTAEIVFTSGATESINLALLGFARYHRTRGKHIVTSRIEHRATLDACKQLEKEGFRVTYLKPGQQGMVHPDQVAEALEPDTLLVSLMHTNNEIGTITDVAAIGELCRARGVAFHLDAAQSAGKLPINVVTQNIDLLSLSAHKINGPKGIGALYVRRDPPLGLQPLMFGGGQEAGLRPGTLPTHQIVGLGTACEIQRDEGANQAKRMEELQTRLWRHLRTIEGAHLNGDPDHLAPHILNVSFDGVEGESLIAELNKRHLAVSSGAACSSASKEPSYVLRALGRTDAQAQSSLRFSFGRTTNADEVNKAAEVVHEAVTELRALSPASDAAQSDWLAGEAGGIDQGTWVRFSVQLEGDRIARARCKVYGCPHTVAAAEWVAKRLPGRKPGELLPEGAQGLAKMIDLPPEKLGRLLLIEDALRRIASTWPSH